LRSRAQSRISETRTHSSPYIFGACRGARVIGRRHDVVVARGGCRHGVYVFAGRRAALVGRGVRRVRGSASSAVCVARLVARL